MKDKFIYPMQLFSIALIWVFVGGICYWILHLIDVAWRLHDVPNASLAISLVAIPVFITIASVLTYVFVGLRRGRDIHEKQGVGEQRDKEIEGQGEEEQPSNVQRSTSQPTDRSAEVRELRPAARDPQGATKLVLLFLVLPVLMAASWSDYQEQYQQHASGASHPIKQETVQNAELGIQDRCLSCHVGVDDDAMRDASQPLQTHSGRILQDHPSREFGCTICHGGRGDTLDEARAHAEGRPQALIKGDLIQTRCTQCHENRNLEGAPALTHGYQRIEELGCTGCHALERFEMKGPPCPPLMGLGSKVEYKWLKRWLKNPQAFNPATTMPDPHLSSEHAEALASYLMSLRDPQLESLPEPPEGDPDEGGNILRTVRCISCHAFNGKGGHLAPDIGKIGNKADPKWLFYMLKDTHGYLPGTAMPQFNFSDQEAADVVEYLIEEYVDYDLLDEYDNDTSTEKRDPETIDVGRRLYKEYRCSNCHAHTGDEEWMQLGPVLTHIGDKKPEEFEFGDSDVPRTTADYIFEKVRNPRAFATETNLLKMPDYHLSDEDAKDITIALLASREGKVESPKYRVPPKLASVYQPSGKAGELFNRYQCFSCHSANGRGHNLAYDLSMEGTRVQRDWLYDYLDLSYSIRPILVERMPVFHFSPEETQVLTDFIMQELTNPEIPADLEAELTPEMAERGRQLFDDKGCMGCHIVNGKGGYVGPSFTIGAKSGDKLQAGWVYQWLKDPQAMVSNVIEPNYQFTDAEAKAVTAYLMSIREEK